MQANSVQNNVSVSIVSADRYVLLMFTEIFRNKIFEYKGRGYTYLLKGSLNTLLLFALLWGNAFIFISEISLSELYPNRLPAAIF